MRIGSGSPQVRPGPSLNSPQVIGPTGARCGALWLAIEFYGSALKPRSLAPTSSGGKVVS